MYLWRIDNHHTLYDNSQKGVREMVTQEIDIGKISTETITSSGELNVFKSVLSQFLFRGVDNYDRLSQVVSSLKAIAAGPDRPVVKKVELSETEDDPMTAHVRGLP